MGKFIKVINADTGDTILINPLTITYCEPSAIDHMKTTVYFNNNMSVKVCESIDTLQMLLEKVY